MPDLRRNIESRFKEETNILFWIFISWIMLLFAWAVLIASFSIDIFTSLNLDLFQRSGAIIVAGGALVEIQLSMNPNWFMDDTLHHKHGGKMETWDKFFARIKQFQKFGWFSVILGTIIWAYGDLIIDLF